MCCVRSLGTHHSSEVRTRSPRVGDQGLAGSQMTKLPVAYLVDIDNLLRRSAGCTWRHRGGMRVTADPR